jgi:hypothetical protein
MSENKPARPWDLFNKNIGRVTEKTKLERLEICKGCEFFIGLTSQCTKCGCFMTAKAALPNAECPLHKWGQIDIKNTSFKKEE